MSSGFERSICWLRRDLRLSDHAALAAATANSESVAVVFIFDTCILDELHNPRDRRLSFILRSLEELDEKLGRLGTQLIVRHGDPTTEIPKLAVELNAQAVFTSKDYEPYALQRDDRVRRGLINIKREFITQKDSVLKEPGEVFSQSQTPFRVYSPYFRAWQAATEADRDYAEHTPDLSRLWPKALLPTQVRAPLPTLKELGFEPVDLWLEPGEDAARERLSRFSRRLSDYKQDRNFPAKHGTSELSAHLRFGTLSIREMARLSHQSPSEGSSSWLGELAWRDFYQDILFHFPYVVERPFQEIYTPLQYPGSEEHFEAWKTGQTGYPIVDAAMRCFNATGWMHNRLRMVVASFLTKDLLVDYRKGEQYFAEGLLDFELASNNGGWQWSASVGADPQPYFRVFNPLLQSQKFDPAGEFIREWCPELRDLDNQDVHCPADAPAMALHSAGVELGVTYPKPIVDHAIQAKKAIALLSAYKSS